MESVGTERAADVPGSGLADFLGGSVHGGVLRLVGAAAGVGAVARGAAAGVAGACPEPVEGGAGSDPAGASRELCVSRGFGRVDRRVAPVAGADRAGQFEVQGGGCVRALSAARRGVVHWVRAVWGWDSVSAPAGGRDGDDR